ncbi:MAG: hypothetical protein LBL80_05760 [Ruminococcus sp.]|jgi:YbbR domain-containing protein|nr:hypothetical protein [Ruminococcus sp.]
MKNFTETLLRRLRMRFTKLMEQDAFIIIMSILTAVLIWFTISVIEYPNIRRQITGVTVQIDIAGTYAEEHNINVSGLSENSVTVEIEGARGEIGDIRADDLIAEVNADSVLSAKDYVLPIEIRSKNDRVFSVSSVNPPTVTVNFEEIITKEVPLSAAVDTISLADGYMIDPENVVVLPGAVAVTGSKDIVDRISNIKLNIPKAGATSSSFELVVGSSDMVIYNENVQMQNVAADLTFDRTDFTVKVPVYRKQTVDLDVTVSNAPETFNIDDFKNSLILSASQMEIAALDQTAALTSLNIGAIDIRQVNFENGTDMTFEFSAENFLPEGYENLSEIGSITVTVPYNGMSRKMLMTPSNYIQLINRPAGFDFEIITSGIQPLFIGPADQISALTREDIIAVVDLNSMPITSAGDLKLTVQFSIPEYPDIWVAANAGVLSQRVTVTVTRTE